MHNGTCPGFNFFDFDRIFELPAIPPKVVSLYFPLGVLSSRGMSCYMSSILILADGG
jgi:hypothetical protein